MVAAAGFPVNQALATMRIAVPHAVGAVVAAADDHHVFAFGGDEIAFLCWVEQGCAYWRSDNPSRWTPLRCGPRRANRALRRAGAQHSRIKLFEQLFPPDN